MSVLLKTRLEVSLKGAHASLCADGFYGKVAEAFQTTSSSDGIALPPPAQLMCGTSPFIGQPLKSGAKFYLVKCEEELSSSPNITIDVFVYADEEDPKPEACVRDFCKRVKRANLRAKGLRIELPYRFYVYPLLDDCPAATDVPFCFLATRESKWSRDRMTAIFLTILIAAIGFALGNALPDVFIFQHFRELLIGIVVPTAVGAALTLVVECAAGRYPVTIALNDAVSREAERMKSSRTAATIAEYEGQTPTLRRSRKVKDNER